MDWPVGSVFMDQMTARESITFCRHLERFNYKVIWTPEAGGAIPSRMADICSARRTS